MKLNRKVVAILVAAAVTVLGYFGIDAVMFIRDVASAISPAV